MCNRCRRVRDVEHDFQGCRCKLCGKVQHDVQGCRCSRCREPVNHEWVQVQRDTRTEYVHVCHDHWGTGNCEDKYVTYTDIRKKCNRCREEAFETVSD